MSATTQPTQISFEENGFDRFPPSNTPYHLEHIDAPAPIQPEVSIFEYYSVANEHRDICRMRKSGVSEAVITSYIQENAVTFGLEFAGLVSHTSIQYKLDQKTGELLYVCEDGQHIRMRDSYEGLAVEAGEGSREHEEYVGYSRCEAALAGGAASAVIVSPPHAEAAELASAGYGLVMAMVADEKDASNVRLHIVRYNEHVGSLSTTNAIASRLQDSYFATHEQTPSGEDGRVYKSESECRTNPFISASDNPEADFHIVLQAVGVSAEKLRLSALYEAKLRQDLMPYINKYSNAVLSGDVRAGREVLSEYFNAAKDLKRRLENHVKEQAAAGQIARARLGSSSARGVTLTEQDRKILEVAMIQTGDARYKGPATAQAGGSCPVSQSGKMVNGLSIDRGLATGQTPESMMGRGAINTAENYKDDPNLCRCGNREPHFHCPGQKDGKACEHPITVGKGISKCPSCGHGKTC